MILKMESYKDVNCHQSREERNQAPALLVMKSNTSGKMMKPKDVFSHILVYLSLQVNIFKQ